MDRDGTLNPDLHYLKEAERLELFRGVGEALALARAHGFVVLCVTNQSGIRRGFYTASDVERIHERLNRLLAPHRAQVDAFYYCPHAPDEGCRCRKPGTELFERARADFGVEFAQSAIIGDRALDIQAGRALGMLTALAIPPGHHAESGQELATHGLAPDVVTDSFRSAVLRVLALG